MAIGMSSILAGPRMILGEQLERTQGDACLENAEARSSF